MGWFEFHVLGWGLFMGRWIQGQAAQTSILRPSRLPEGIDQHLCLKRWIRWSQFLGGIIMNHSSLHFRDFAIVCHGFLSGCCRYFSWDVSHSSQRNLTGPTSATRQTLLESFKQRLSEGQSGEKVDAEFRWERPAQLNPDIQQFRFLTWEIIEANGKILGVWTCFDCHSWMMGEVPGQKWRPGAAPSLDGVDMARSMEWDLYRHHGPSTVCTSRACWFRQRQTHITRAGLCKERGLANSMPPGRRYKRSWKPVTSGCWPVYAPMWAFITSPSLEICSAAPRPGAQKPSWSVSSRPLLCRMAGGWDHHGFPALVGSPT